MSTPTKPTRQQLDELDALLQRMLSLPINQVEPEAAPPPMPEPRPMPPPSPPMPMRTAPPPPPPAFEAPRRAAPPMGDHAWNVPLPPGTGGATINTWPTGIESLQAAATSSVTPKPAPPVGKLNVTTIPSPDEQNRAREAPPSRARFDAVPVTPLPLPVPEAPLPFYLWPLGAIDRMMAGAMAGFGPVGRWFGEGGGKKIVGGTGFLMLAAAAAWGMMDYLGLSW